MTATAVLSIFIVLRLAQHLAERGLVRLNRRYYLDPARQEEARTVLGLSQEDMARSVAYSEDRARFGFIRGWVMLVPTLALLAAGALGLVERWAGSLTGGGGVAQGLAFFGLLGLASSLTGLPFEYYRIFVIEERHGFNRQTRRGFWLDQLKGLALTLLLGGGILGAVLWIMGAAGDRWWVWAWLVVTVFSIVAAWVYPTLLAPLFNKFSPVEDGELKRRIDELADRVGFRVQEGGIFVMDASKRSSHGNAYFTGVFGKKRIVIFDTLLEPLSVSEVIAVLAHELGHFKLRHVRWALIRGMLMTGVTFYLLSLCVGLETFYAAFGLSGPSSYGALLVFMTWFGLLDFALQPAVNWLSRRNEFAADEFAQKHVDDRRALGNALLKMREKSHSMPISHPLFSSVYYSHPPIIERLRAMGG